MTDEIQALLKLADSDLTDHKGLNRDKVKALRDGARDAAKRLLAVEAELARLREPVGEIRIGDKTLAYWRKEFEHFHVRAIYKPWDEALDLIERQQVELAALRGRLEKADMLLEALSNYVSCTDPVKGNTVCRSCYECRNCDLLKQVETWRAAREGEGD